MIWVRDETPDALLASLEAGATLAVGVDRGPFEITIGGGWSTLRERSRGQSVDGPVAAATLRIGWPEGAHFEGRFALVFADLLADIATIDGRLQIPVSPSVRLLGVGGFGVAGLWRGAAGAQLFVEGHGGPGSTALSVLGGVMGMFEREICPEGRCRYRYLVSPAVLVELEWRP